MSLTCHDVMLPKDRQHLVYPENSVFDAFHIMRESRARFLPVVHKDGTYAGVFTAPTLLRLLLPRAATINLGWDDRRTNLGNLGFMSMEKEDFDAQIDRLHKENITDFMSDPSNIPTTAPNTPVMAGILLIYQYKRHLILVEPDTQKFVGTVSANSLLDRVLG
ncbi:MAG: CBS domain-containing protein [Pseudomonadota bacterium]